MTRPDLAWSYSELSKYVKFPGKPHMLAAEHVCRTFVALTQNLFSTVVTFPPRYKMSYGGQLIQTGQVTQTLVARTLDMSSC